MTWELKRIVVRYDRAYGGQTGVSNSGGMDRRVYSKGDDNTKEAWAKADTAAAEGWELVSAVPFIEGHEEYYEFGGHTMTLGSSVTDRVLLIFKRALPE